MGEIGTLCSLALAVIGSVVATVAWAHSRFESTAREAREYTDHSLEKSREHTRDVYARREDMTRIEAKFDSVMSLLNQILDRVSHDRSPAE